MAKKFTFATYDNQHLRNLYRRATNLSDILGDAAKQAVKIGEATGFCDATGEFRFDKFPAIKERVDGLFRALHKRILLNITEGDREEWLLSAAKNDALVKSYVGSTDKYGEQAKKWLQPNLKALEAFQSRKEKGMTLSDRVWKLTDQYKSELELALEMGLGDGKSAAALSRDVRQYMNEPHKLFRRVRNEKGQLRLSKAAAAYHPGQGVYRSSYKNALRLTATENNMAYRTADHERWQQLDFVIGYEIRLSGNHPCEDVCDRLAGVYPKSFKFTGWHPFCRCTAIPKLADKEEFIARQRAKLKGEEVPTGYGNEITEMPEGFNEWVEENKERIENAKTEPYFIRDNRKAVEAAMNPSIPHYGAAMKLGRSATKEAMKIVENIGTPILTDIQKQNVCELADALSIPRKDIKPMSFLDADQGASNPTKDNENCQSVVIAFEARRRGLDCYAMPYDHRRSSASYVLGERFQDAWINPNTGKIIEPTICRGKTDEEVLLKLRKNCTADGRYVLGVNYKNGGGHVLSIECINGKLIIKDEQVDTFYDLSSLQGIEFIELIKIDKAIFNIEVINSVLGFTL
ncbi:toxin glutamine deamidase domain-containing protein [Paramuribaculum intestinale]|uniref:toxin glutamine deamidase domain-containing protein n=1 Tax=Paramuribaculum intestinale TaxID=2094151 RepID=UPI0025A9F488|nr:toxin glutamine deamidase domain-containing protein [Paramuribaculum intestinale]